jgi:hypothetical protein
MSDGYIKIDTKVDETGIDKGVASVDKKLKGTEKTTASTGKSFAALGLKVAAVAGALKVAADVVGDLTDAYKTQIKAETQLESAAKNNPYLDESSVNVLKEYASEIQSYSTFGDESLLPMMAKLAAAGRTQEEIMLVMSTATDMAASGAFSLDAAVANLNKSYGGLSGELGESIPEIKSLTSEQLKNGEAVKLLAGRYKGIAKDVAKTTGTAEQLSNAMGDLKEELGAPFEKAMSPIRIYFTELIAGWTNAKKAKRLFEEAKEEVKEKGADAALESLDIAGKQAFADVADIKARLLEVQAVQKEGWVKGSAYSSLSKKELAATAAELARQLSVAEKSLAQLREQYIAKKNSIEQSKIAAEKATTEAEAAKALSDRNKEAADYIVANTAAREKALKQLELQAQAEGRSVTAEEKLGVYAQSYVDLVANSNGLVSTHNQAATSLLNTTREISAEVEAQNGAREEATVLEEQLKEVLDSIEAADPRKESEKMNEQIAILDNYYMKVQQSESVSADDKIKVQEEYLAKRKILLGLEGEAAKEEAEKELQDRREKAVSILTIANNFATQYADIMNSISSLVTQQIEDEATLKTAALEKQYADGEISAEEYENKLTDIKRDAAEEKYKIDMWVWSSQILSALSNTALGIAQTLADATLPTVARIALGSLVGIAGAAQLATIIANKPIPPSFATGGVVGGTSFVGDKVTANVNSAERILTAQQNAAFERLAYGKGGSGDIKVYNSVSNEVTAKPQITEDGIKIMIEKTVNSQMADGRFNKSYRTMQNNLRGTRYTN